MLNIRGLLPKRRFLDFARNDNRRIIEFLRNCHVELVETSPRNRFFDLGNTPLRIEELKTETKQEKGDKPCLN